MFEKRHRDRLSRQDHQTLVKLVNTDKEKVRKIAYVRILLLSDEGAYGAASTAEEIALFDSHRLLDSRSQRINQVDLISTKLGCFQIGS